MRTLVLLFTMVGCASKPKPCPVVPSQVTEQSVIDVRTTDHAASIADAKYSGRQGDLIHGLLTRVLSQTEMDEAQSWGWHLFVPLNGIFDEKTARENYEEALADQYELRYMHDLKLRHHAPKWTGHYSYIEDPRVSGDLKYPYRCKDCEMGDSACIDGDCMSVEPFPLGKKSPHGDSEVPR